MNTASARAYNEAFLDRISTSDGMNKTAAYQGGVLRDRIREDSFMAKILPVQPITAAECQESMNNDTLIKIDHIEPNSRAMSCTFRGNAPSVVIRGNKVATTFFKLETQHYEKNEAEILAYPYQITQWIEKNTASDIQAIRDRYMLLHAEACVQLMQYQHNGDAYVKLTGATASAETTTQYSAMKSAAVVSGASDTSDGFLAINKEDFASLMQLFPGNDGRALEGSILLMTSTDSLEIAKWQMNDVGSAVVGQTVVEGFKYDTLFGYPFVKTIKTDILRRGNIYAFTKPEFLGFCYLLQKVRFFMERVGDRFQFWAWEYFGASFAQVEAIKKLEGYSSSVTPTATTGTPVMHKPKAEDVIGPTNNQAGQGNWYPKLTQY